MSLPKEKMVPKNYNVIQLQTGDGDPVDTVPVKLWNKHVTIESQAIKQLLEVASMPFVKPYVAAMPDTHWGMGATVGSVIPTVGAVMPAAVGVDIGCGMMAVRTNLPVKGLDASWLKIYFDAISEAVPHGRTNNGGEGDIGAWAADKVPTKVQAVWKEMLLPKIGYGPTTMGADDGGVFSRHPGALSKNAERHLGTLGTGNHFIEVCSEIVEHYEPEGNLWVVIHSGSRGFGNRIGTYFTKLAGDLCNKWQIKLPNKDLGYLPVGTQEYKDYLEALDLAQNFAWHNRELMMMNVLKALGAKIDEDVTNVPAMIHMHHNYANINGGIILTRKGAVDASKGKWVIIPGSMGAKTYIGKGLGSKDSFNSCSHGAGRAMSRTEALKKFTVEDHQKATAGVYCDKTEGVLDETPAAYKDIDLVMESQKDLVEPVIKIKQLVCVKGLSD